MLNNQIKDKVEVRKSFSNEKINVLGNAGKIHQVFINILLNSIQAIATKGTILIKTYKQEKNIIIEISDTGCGISKENLLKVTDPFFTTKDPGKGTGLGLSISYNIIQDHKGKLEFESEIDKGTIVKISLPINNYE
jgi:signal transduction histidine kinase